MSEDAAGTSGQECCDATAPSKEMPPETAALYAEPVRCVGRPSTPSAVASAQDQSSAACLSCHDRLSSIVDGD